MKRYNSVPESNKPSKPIQWKESFVPAARYLACCAWCQDKLGDEYHCWHISGQKWGSNRGQWKTYTKKGTGGEINVFCFRDEKVRLECELKFG